MIVPLTRAGAPLLRRMFAFWPKERDAQLQRELSEALKPLFG